MSTYEDYDPAEVKTVKDWESKKGQMSDLEKLGGLETAKRLAKYLREDSIPYWSKCGDLVYALIERVKELERELAEARYPRKELWYLCANNEQHKDMTGKCLYCLLQSARELAEMASILEKPDHCPHGHLVWHCDECTVDLENKVLSVKAKAREFLEGLKK